MNRKGFTLVELLAVTMILGLLIIIVSTRGFGAFNKTKESINKIEEENLLEAAKTYLVEIDNGICGTDCPTRDTCLGGCEVTVGDLESKGFFDDKKNKCDDDAILILKIEEARDEDGSTYTTGYSARKDSEEPICVN